MSTKTTEKPKKFTSKFFRVATEGTTTDGREIRRDWISQMAANYDPKKYGARVWIEHIRGISPDSSFRAYGDVVELEAREVEDGKLALFAKIDPTPELIDLTKKRQKVYSSIEINPKFADTGEAYMVGLAVTDSPASLGTELLEFAQKNPASSPFAARKLDAENLFSAGIEAALEFEEQEPAGEALLDRVRAALKRFSSTEKAASAAAREEMDEAVVELAEDLSKLHKTFADVGSSLQKLNSTVEALGSKVESLEQRIETTPEKHSQRPPATGGTGKVLTDC